MATTQTTVDGVIDPGGEWVQADGDHGDYSALTAAGSMTPASVAAAP
jgi:hypothetical protein